jgi:hypothetical protein
LSVIFFPEQTISCKCQVAQWGLDCCCAFPTILCRGLILLLIAITYSAERKRAVLRSGSCKRSQYRVGFCLYCGADHVRRMSSWLLHKHRTHFCNVSIRPTVGYFLYHYCPSTITHLLFPRYSDFVIFQSCLYNPTSTYQ